MSEQEAQTATAVYAQLVAARQELARLLAVRPLLNGLTLHAPGTPPIRIEGVQAERLNCAAQVAEIALCGRVADLEAKLGEL